MKKLVFIFFLFISLGSFAQEEIPFTLADRDRLIRLEAEQKAIRNEMNSLRNEMNTKFESVEDTLENHQSQINDLKIMFRWGFSILITLMLFILGYIIWDRRTALHPIKESLDHDKVEIGKIKSALKEMGESDDKIAEILRRVAIF